MPDPKKPCEEQEAVADDEDHGGGLARTFQEIEADLLDSKGEEPTDTGP